MDKTNRLGSEPVGKLLWQFFVPAFIGVIANALYNIVDRIFIGRFVGAEALSGIGVVYPVMLIVMGFGMLIGIGAGVVASIRLGQKNKDGAETVMGTAVAAIVVVSLVISGTVYCFKNPMLQSFGATSVTIAYANSYLNIILGGTIFSMLGFSLNNVIRSEGNARIAMMSMLISAGVNVVLDYLFVVRFGWGVAGAAWATFIAMFVLSVWVVLHFTGKRCVVQLKWAKIRFDWPVLKNIFAIGMSPFAMQIASSIVQGLFNRQLIKYGSDTAVGAMSIVVSVIALIVMCLVAVNMASQPIIGYNFGAKNLVRVRRTLKLALISATLFSVAAWIAVEVFAPNIVSLFNNDHPELKRIAIQGLRIAMVALPIIGFQVVGGFYFQSVGRAKIAIFLTLLRQVLVLFPLLLVFPGIWGLKGIWISMPISDMVSATVCAFFIFREWKKLSVNQAESLVKV